jgi:hypothetical protein
MIVHFVAIGGIDDHRSLNFLFILNLSFHGVWGSIGINKREVNLEIKSTQNYYIFELFPIHHEMTDLV